MIRQKAHIEQGTTVRANPIKVYMQVQCSVMPYSARLCGYVQRPNRMSKKENVRRSTKNPNMKKNYFALTNARRKPEA